MSNRWKIIGLCCVDPDVLQKINAMRPEIRRPPFKEGIQVMDKTLIALGCPLGNLEAQDMFDLLHNDVAWATIAKISGKFAKISDPYKYSEYCMAIGLAAVDLGLKDGTPPFRIRLTGGAVEAAKSVGLLLDQEMGAKVENGLREPDVMTNMGLFSQFWEDISTISLTDRRDYPRLKKFPPGWSKMSGEKATEMVNRNDGHKVVVVKVVVENAEIDQ